MTGSPEVLIVGAGPAGIAAALRLARAGVRVLVLEGADYAGAENWSGCVYHADPLLRPDVLGADLWQQAPKERRVVARSLFLHDGLHAAGFEARANNDNDFGEAWTVLRPKLDRWLATRAIEFGATLLTNTTVGGLRYRDGRVVGVNTHRGPIEADVVFLAEGDAASLLAREGLERQAQPHYAQGIKAVFRLPVGEIEKRFAISGDQGIAQEWILRNGSLAGRRVPLNVTAFLYTNRDTLSLGAVLPLDHLAKHGAADHPHIFQRVLETPSIAAYLKGAEQVAYGAKVIRSGGLNDTPEWARDGLAVGGGALGLGQEVPYPNFIAPAMTSALCFADAFLRLRDAGSRYSRADLEREYGAALKQTPDYASAELIRRWPGAIHGGGMLFDHMPNLLGAWVDAQALPSGEARATRQRALAVQLSTLHKDLAQGMKMLRGLGPGGAPPQRIAPLDVRFFTARAGSLPMPVTDTNALLDLMGQAIGHFYGRRLLNFRERIALAWRGLGKLPLALFTLSGMGLGAMAGGVRLAGDLAAYKVRKIPLRELLSRPYHRHVEAARKRLAWTAARRSPVTPTGWIAPLERYQPDKRHISVPLGLDPDAAQGLRNVCPAEVYSLVSRLGGVASQYENCIKCESCRVSVPGVDWNRTSDHRLAYRVPGDGRYGFDSSVRTTIEWHAPLEPTLSDAARDAWLALYRALRARPAMVGEEWQRSIAALIKALPRDAGNGALFDRLERWQSRHAYGWIESEASAVLRAAQALPSEAAGTLSPDEYARRRREQHWDTVLQALSTQRLRELAGADWSVAERDALLAFVRSAREARTEAIQWLAARSSDLAWAAANHYLAEDYAKRSIDDRLAAPLWRERDGLSNWLPGIAQVLIDAQAHEHRPLPSVAHGHGSDAAHPIRVTPPAAVDTYKTTPLLAHLSLSLALGAAQELRRRAVDYAANRVQFRGELKDREGRDGVAKFGGVKRMLAGIEHAWRSLNLARPWCDPEPDRVLHLVREHMGPWMDAVPWLAGQIFGGMAYSEEDILAPRYRAAMLFSQWPGAPELQLEDPDFGLRVLNQAAPSLEATQAQALIGFAQARYAAQALRPAPAEPEPPHRKRPRYPLTWRAHDKYLYKSGSFLNGQLLAPSQVLTREHYLRDPVLRQTRAEVLRLLRNGFKVPSEHRSYGRYIDALHGMPQEDIDRLRDFNAFATVVPADLGGKGWNKAQYSVLTNLGMGRMDTAFGLLIMASTSIGTMPVILGRDKDLPKIRAELEACLSDRAGWDALRNGLDELIAMTARPDPKTFRAAMEAFGKHLQKMFLFPGSALKYVARGYLTGIKPLAAIAKSRDMEALAKALKAARAGLDGLYADLQAEFDELDRRAAAHARFLSFLATGQISAFALTEPAAGSDTGGIQTRAVLRSVAAMPQGDGLYQFIPHGGKEPRIVMDASRLEFQDRRAYYRLDDGARAQLDDSDWDLQKNRGRRKLRAGDRSLVYDDIGTVVPQGDGFVYRYWELNGNKMWITNGSVADRYSLFSQSERGEIAFMLERRSEGLRIGPNENKLGQRASPTNELTFDRVRISAENVIGFTGHGQVNALETLSVGRGGLVMSCATLGRRLLEEFAEVWKRDPAQHAIAQGELDRIETLAARLVGLMDRADLDRGDFRIEAALSKYLASEGAHRILGALEKLIGPQAVAREMMLEKWRRDVRILNIYEGTNEVQRFLVLKDLPNLLREAAVPVTNNEPLEAALQSFRDFAAPHIERLGAALWQDPDLQARWFPVVDWVAELYSWCALHERRQLLESLNDPADVENISRLRGGEASLAQHVQALAQRIRADFAAHERDGVHPEDVHLSLARIALTPEAEAPSGPFAVGELSGEFGVIVRSRYELRNDQLIWAGWNDTDLAALDRVLTWADRSSSLQVKLAVLAPQELEDRVRRLQAAGAETVHIVHAPGAGEALATASAVRARWPNLRHWVIGRAAGNARDESYAMQLAALLGADLADSPAAVGMHGKGLWLDDAQGHRHQCDAARPLVLALDLKSNGRSDAFAFSDWLSALRSELPVHASDTKTAPMRVRSQAAASTGDLPEAFNSPSDLVQWLTQRFGDSARSEPLAGIKETRDPFGEGLVWLAAPETLSSARASSALRLIHDLSPSSVRILTWQNADGGTLRLAQGLQIPELRGVWRAPLRQTLSAAALARSLAPQLGQRRIVVQADQRALAAALAAELRLELFDGVVGADASRVTCDHGSYLVDFELPPSAVLIAAADYPERKLAAARAGAINVSTLEAIEASDSALERWLAHARDTEGGLAGAPIVVDVGMGVAGEAAYKKWVLPLRDQLAAVSGQRVEIGATRKITQEQKLLPLDRQIGQTGIAVMPELLFALGISGAPQHMSWIDPKAVVIAINRDADAPIFHWHRHNPGPRVIACVGDLEEWVPAIIKGLAAGGESEVAAA